MTTLFLTNLLYLSGAVCFVLGMRFLSAPDTARKGNLVAATGVFLATLGALTEPISGAFSNLPWIIGGIATGAGAGYYLAVKATPTSMPHLVSVLNGLGGAGAAVLGLAEILLVYNGESAASGGILIAIIFTITIGGVVFAGSLLAYAKLEGHLEARSITLNRHDLVNYLLLTTTVVCGIFVYLQGGQGSSFWAAIFMLIAMVYGLSWIAPVETKDILLVVSLLNALSGLSTAGVGLIYDSRFLLIGGVLVGAAGITLTAIMCRTLNRSLIEVLTRRNAANITEELPDAEAEVTGNDRSDMD